MVYGVYCYALQGQYVYTVSYQGVSPYGWQTFGNALGLITSLLAACLYGNIGIKVLYNNVGRDLMSSPILESKKGKWIWVIFVPFVLDNRTHPCRIDPADLQLPVPGGCRMHSSIHIHFPAIHDDWIQDAARRHYAARYI